MYRDTGDGGGALSRFSSLDRVLKPRSVAVIGASADRTRIGGRPIDYMLQQAFQGRIFPVNPNRAEIQGLPAFASVAALPEAPDTAIVAVPTALAMRAIEDLGAKGVKSAIVFTAGFAEMDAAGGVLQAEMLATAQRYGMRLVGPNCLGLFNAHIGFYAIFSSSLESGWPCAGRVGIASQSGAYGTHMFAIARNRGIGTPVCVTTGNEGDVTIGDVIGWMAEDPETDVITAYAEGIRESESLLAALEAARRARKPVVMMKVGTSVVGAQAATSHTASIAGNDAVTDAVLAEFGVVRARTTEEMLDIATTATRKVYPVGNTLGVITISGGAGVLISDAAEVLGLPLPAMPEAAQSRLKDLVPFSAPRNPVDCTAQAFNDLSLVGKFMDSMVDDGGIRRSWASSPMWGGAGPSGRRCGSSCGRCGRGIRTGCMCCRWWRGRRWCGSTSRTGMSCSRTRRGRWWRSMRWGGSGRRLRGRGGWRRRRSRWCGCRSGRLRRRRRSDCWTLWGSRVRRKRCVRRRRRRCLRRRGSGIRWC